MARSYGVNTSPRFPRLDRGFTQWRSIRREDRRLRSALVEGRRPIVVYSHPKTASRSVEQAIAGSPDCEVFHCHVLRPEHFTRRFEPTTPIHANGMVLYSEPTQWPLHRRLVGRSGDAGAIQSVTLVRDPVATSISWLYFGLQRWLRSWRPVDPQRLDDAAWRDIFRTRFPGQGLWAWWEDEFIAVTGIDPRVEGFDARRGWSIYRQGRFESLIMSVHLDDTAKTEVLRKFLGPEVSTVERRNVSASRAGDDEYRRVRDLIGADAAYCRGLLEHPWTRVFFSPAKIREFADRWACGGSGSSSPQVTPGGGSSGDAACTGPGQSSVRWRA